MNKVLVVYHDADSIFYECLARLTESTPELSVTVAAPEEAAIRLPNPLRRVPMKAIRSKFTRAAITSLRRVIRDMHPDIIFAPSTSGLSTAILATAPLALTPLMLLTPGLFSKGPAIVGYRGTQARVHAMDPTYRMALLNPRVDHIICETPDIEEYLRHYIPAEKLSTHLKPYDLSWAEAAIADPILPEGKTGKEANVFCRACRPLELIYVGMSEGRPHKGLRHLLRAVDILRQKAVDVHLTVVGSADREDIDSAAANVTFVGPSREAMHYIAGADVYVLPSERDASPRVLREAQACSLPCVVADIPGARDLIISEGPDQTGILVTPKSPEAIAEAIELLDKDTELRRRLAANARRNIADNYRMDSYIDYFRDLFTALIAKKRHD